jgi:hypothetical protein
MSAASSTKGGRRPTITKQQPITVIDIPTATPAEVVEEPAKKRAHPAGGIGVYISAARCRRHIDSFGLNEALDSHILAYKAQLAALASAEKQLETGEIACTVEKEVQVVKGKETVTKLKSVESTRPITPAERAVAQAIVDKRDAVNALIPRVIALSRERTRFSNESSVVLSIICNEIISQCADHTMNRALAAKKKIIQVAHLHADGVEKLPLYPLISTLPTFRETAERLSKAASDKKIADDLAAARSQAEKDFRKKHNVKVPKRKKVAVADTTDGPAAEAAEPEIASEEVVDSKTSFKFYVHLVCKELVRQNEAYKTIRVSTEIRSYLSDMLVEFIERIAPLVQLVADTMNIKTVNDVAIMHTIESLLVDGHTPVEDIMLEDAMVLDPAIVKAEVAKRDAAKAAGESYKIDFAAIPKIPGFAAVRTVTYPTSGYASLRELVAQKLALYKALPPKEKLEKPAADAPEVADVPAVETA